MWGPKCRQWRRAADKAEHEAISVDRRSINEPDPFRIKEPEKIRKDYALAGALTSIRVQDIRRAHAAGIFVSAATLLLCVSYLDHRERSVLPLRRLHLVQQSFTCL